MRIMALLGVGAARADSSVGHACLLVRDLGDKRV